MINQTLMYLLLVIYENVNISTYYIGIIYKDETSLIFCTTKGSVYFEIVRKHHRKQDARKILGISSLYIDPDPAPTRYTVSQRVSGSGHAHYRK